MAPRAWLARCGFPRSGADVVRPTRRTPGPQESSIRPRFCQRIGVGRGPVLAFASLFRGRRCEWWKQRTTSKFKLRVERTCHSRRASVAGWVANVKSAALAAGANTGSHEVGHETRMDRRSVRHLLNIARVRCGGRCPAQAAKFRSAPGTAAPAPSCRAKPSGVRSCCRTA